jgi:hypothetical protein
MALFNLILSSFWFLVILGAGWIGLTILVGSRAGVSGGIRLLLLGLGLFAAFLIAVAVLVYSPDWLAVTFMLVAALVPWISIFQYFVNSRMSGRMLLALSSKRRSWDTSVPGGALLAAFGLLTFRFNDPFPSMKSYALGILCISWGIFGIIQKIRYSQIREKGILYEFGRLYRWENIESYSWRFGEDKLTLKLKKSLTRHNVTLKLPSQFRQEVVDYLSHNIENLENDG